MTGILLPTVRAGTKKLGNSMSVVVWHVSSARATEASLEEEEMIFGS